MDLFFLSLAAWLFSTVLGLYIDHDSEQGRENRPGFSTIWVNVQAEGVIHSLR